MQAEGIRKGDRLDAYGDRGEITGGWTAKADAVAQGDQVSVLVRTHDGFTYLKTFRRGEQVPITWGSGA